MTCCWPRMFREECLLYIGEIYGNKMMGYPIRGVQRTLCTVCDTEAILQIIIYLIQTVYRGPIGKSIGYMDFTQSYAHDIPT